MGQYTHSVHVLRALKQLFHVEFNMAGLQFDPFVFKKTRKVMIHIREDHVYRKRIVCGAYFSMETTIAPRKNELTSDDKHIE
jgi:hypothetical protein